MYAIISTGGKQATVSEGTRLDVELIDTAEEQVSFTPLLVVNDEGGVITARDELSDLEVTAKVLGRIKGKNVEVFKYKNKSGYRRRQGHRQNHTRIEVTYVGPSRKED